MPGMINLALGWAGIDTIQTHARDFSLPHIPAKGRARSDFSTPLPRQENICKTLPQPALAAYKPSSQRVRREVRNYLDASAKIISSWLFRSASTNAPCAGLIQVSA